jgi:HAD superfamily hydrolase (TIGR01490 family)
MSTAEKIGAFFDLDGTLLPAPSLEWRFIAWLAARDEIGGRDVARWIARFARTILHDPHGAAIGNKLYLTGLRESLAADWGDSLAPGRLPFFRTGIAAIDWHIGQGHRVHLVSGTLAPLARMIARHLPGRVEILATELEACDGHWTGYISGRHMSGEEKARAILNVAARFGISLWDSDAYGNSVTDLPMLDSVGHRTAVNPHSKLRRIARNEGWQTCVWTEPIDAASAARAHGFSPEEAR